MNGGVGPTAELLDRETERGELDRVQTAARDGLSAVTQVTWPYYGPLTAVVLGQGSMARFSDRELNLSRRKGDP